MSALRYTFYSESLREEITAVLTLPEKRLDCDRALKAMLIFPERGREADYLLRFSLLEEYSRGHDPMATVSLPGRLLSKPDEDLEAFANCELKSIAELFRLCWQATYTCAFEDRDRLMGLRSWNPMGVSESSFPLYKSTRHFDGGQDTQCENTSGTAANR